VLEDIQVTLTLTNICLMMTSSTTTNKRLMTLCFPVCTSGSPFQFNVLDPNKVIVRGSGLDLVPVNEPASFMIIAPSAQMQDIDVTITG